MLGEECCGPTSVWELGQPSCGADWTVGSDWVSLRGFLKEGRAFRICLSVDSWGAEEILFGVGLVEAKWVCWTIESNASWRKLPGTLTLRLLLAGFLGG